MSISNTIAQISNAGISRPTRFNVQIIIPLSAFSESIFTMYEFITENLLDNNVRLNLSVEQVSMPGKALATADVSSYGPQRKFPYVTTYEDVIMSMRLSKDLNERKIIDAWMATAIDTVTNDVNYMKEYAGSVIIEQLDENDNKVYGVTLHNAYPIAMGNLEMDHSAKDSYHKQQVTFTYHKYIRHDFREELFDTRFLPIQEIPTIRDIIDGNFGGSIFDPLISRGQTEIDKLLSPISDRIGSITKNFSFFNF